MRGAHGSNPAPWRADRGRLPFTLIAAILAGCLAPDSSGASDLERLLKEPVSPGTIGRLVAHTADPRAVSRLESALEDPIAERRAASARVITIACLRNLRSRVEAALESEKDPSAAREEIRALATLAGSSSEAAVVRAARRFGTSLDSTVADALARSAGPEMIDRILAGTLPFAVSEPLRIELLVIASRGQVGVLERLAGRAIERGDWLSWMLSLRAIQSAGWSENPTQLRASLRGPSPVAIWGAWSLVSVYAFEPPPDRADFLASLQVPAGADPSVVLAFELLGRSLGRPPVDLSASIATTLAAFPAFVPALRPGGPALRLLGAAEIAAVRRADFNSEVGGDWTPPARRAQERGSSFAPLVRTAGDLPSGVGRSLIDSTDCRGVGERSFGLAEVRYGADGRPNRVSIVHGFGPRKCEDAATALFLLTLAPRSAFPVFERPDMLIAVSDSGCPGSLDEDPVAERDGIPDNAEIRPPVLEKRVDPVFIAPNSSVPRGTVVLEADISRDGCIRRVRVVRSADAQLDVEAVRALSQWRYRPARLPNGDPVPFTLTVWVRLSVRGT